MIPFLAPRLRARYRRWRARHRYAEQLASHDALMRTLAAESDPAYRQWRADYPADAARWDALMREISQAQHDNRRTAL